MIRRSFLQLGSAAAGVALAAHATRSEAAAAPHAHAHAPTSAPPAVAPDTPAARSPIVAPGGQVAVEPGDWGMHCHMTHHVMTQMGHGLPPMVGVNTKKLDHRMSRVMPEYMTMGTKGMGGMGEMEMKIPDNSLPMRGGPGPFSYIDMGGMFTVLKVRDDPAAAPNAWYRHPAGTVAGPADAARLAADGIDPAAASRR